MKPLRLYSWQGVSFKGDNCSGYQLCAHREQGEQQLMAEGIIAYHFTLKHRRLMQSWQLNTLIVFFQQLESMLNAGLTLSVSLNLLMSNQPSLPWRIVIELLLKKISAGEKLSAALSQWPQIFPPTLSALISAGELTGHLPNSCLQVVKLLEQRKAMREELVAALRYPCITLFFLVFTTAGLLAFVLPEFAVMYQSLNAPLPYLTQLLISASQSINAILPLLCLLSALVLPILHYGDRRYPSWKLMRHRLLLTTPLVGEVWRSRQLSLLFSTLASTQQSGLTLLNGLQLVASIFTSPLWKQSIETVYQRLHTGEKLSQALAYDDHYPSLPLLLIRSAEETGQLDNAFSQLATWYSDQASTLSRRLTQRIEPLMLTVSGGLVGGVVIALYLPIFYLGEALG
ncbi:type II secretion system F family protein [Rosenbergiella epipactidis]|uniref:type II secretion system F family protein n=1 Tax=Rosenbergiella epipactidis TaxID=1544694 RepID=UPI00202656DD|nr:type II secretion system F family protein [Rosenbergiella epipactidis]MCL9668338.1 type II secretion system F family protein [Rosenbergiella epipactidis]